MGIQINGTNDTISATDNSLSVVSSESTFSGLTTFTNGLNANELSVTGIITATTLSGNVTGNVTGDLTGNVTGDLTGNVTGNINSSGVSTVTTLNATTISGVSTIGVTTATITTLTVNGNAYPSAGPLSNRNLVINGAMQVAQRGTVVNAGNEYAGPDRFRFSKNDGAFTISQDTDVPSGQGFANSWKADVTSVSGTAGSFYVILEHRIEGQNLQMLKKGTASAESVTVQFWIKTSKTGTYIVELRDTDNNRSISQSYTVSAADTWEKKTLTFPGDTSGALNNDNGSSLTLLLWLYAGSTFTSGTLQTSWGAETDANKAVGQVNAGDNTANNIYITGVQLEVGEVATPFEHRSYGEELALCQRYYERIFINSNGNTDGVFGLSNMLSTTVAKLPFYWKVEKRTNASFVLDRDGGTLYQRTAVGNSVATSQTITIDAVSSTHANISISSNGTTFDSGAIGQVRVGQSGSGNASFKIDAEL